MAKSIKNQIYLLKKQYTQYHNWLEETGHGLVTGGHTSDIVVDTSIHNVWFKQKNMMEHVQDLNKEKEQECIMVEQIQTKHKLEEVKMKEKHKWRKIEAEHDQETC
ncbi:hypothetical protein BDN71DRAFT_1431886 [Pleurotus eryngii]|uniref:Uncharacterized protein n=1 Tax=Pleurotus eryngii TaxID=5323 RepID=A0A9P5ZVH0_PLEER|nr:hypothetical protein BDN71DRAFT_1431886 [Pleurotus eryngii]